MIADKLVEPSELVTEAERLGFKNVAWRHFPGEDEPDDGFLWFETPEAAETFFDLLEDDEIDSFEPGDLSVDVSKERRNATLETMKSIQTTAQLELLDRFLSNLADVDEDGEDWQNRLGWAWYKLAAFAKSLGPDYAKAVEAYHIR